jgi:hypothetical protein
MLNSISDVTAAAAARTVDCWPATGAFLSRTANAAHQLPGGARVFARPRAITGASAFGRGRKAAVHGLPQGQPSIRKQYPTMARSAAAFGGALGPHPARDPV